MSNSNYSIGLQRLKPFTLRTVACTIWPKIGLGHETWMAETETSASRDRDETETRRWYFSRPSRDRDVETETTTLPIIENS